MALVELNRNPTPKEVRQFAGAWLPAACLIAALVCRLRFESWPLAILFAAIAVFSIALGLLQARMMRAVLIAWLLVSFPLGWVVAQGLMMAVYFGLVMPIGLVMRALGRDPLTRKIDRKASTYWVRRRPPRELESYFRQF